MTLIRRLKSNTEQVYVFELLSEPNKEGNRDCFGRAKITFKDGEFLGCSIPFRDHWTREHWKIIRQIADEITAIEQEIGFEG